MINKYKNKKVKLNGRTFDSKAESEFYQMLIYHKINFKCQAKYEIRVNNILICNYYADFVVEAKNKQYVVDVKGYQTREFVIKRKLMKAVYGIDVLVIKKSEFLPYILVFKNLLREEDVYGKTKIHSR